MNLLGLILPWWVKWAALALVAVASAAAGACVARVFSAHEYDQLDRRFADFRSDVVKEGYAARLLAQQTTINDKRRKETADADLKAARAAADSAYRGWLQLAQSRAGSGYLPAPAANSASFERACVERAEFERAMGELDRAGAAIAQAGDTCRVDLDAAKRWAAR